MKRCGRCGVVAEEHPAHERDQLLLALDRGECAGWVEPLPWWRRLLARAVAR